MQAEAVLPRRGPRGLIRKLPDADVEALLTRNWWGILSTTEARGPYAVPVVYGYDGERFYFAGSPGRKTRNLEERPGVCLDVVEVDGPGMGWRSVVVLGEARRVEGPRELLHALAALRRQTGTPGSPRPADIARIARARVYRIDPSEVTGRSS